MDFALKDLIYIVGLSLAGLGAFFALKTEVAVVRNELNNHKENHKALEQRVTDHEDKINERLSKMDTKIDSNHKETTETLTKLLVAVEGLRK